MKLDLKLTKTNIIILILSLVMVFLITAPFMEDYSIAELMAEEDWWSNNDQNAGLRTVLWIFWIALILTNVFAFLNRYDFAKLAGLVTLIAIIMTIVLFFFVHGRVDGGWVLDNIASIGTLYFVLTGIIAGLCWRASKKQAVS